MPIWTLARKDLRQLQRDYRSAVILLAMPIVFVAVLSLAVGRGFGQKPDDRLRISVVNLDTGKTSVHRDFPGRPWSQVVLDDLAGTADIRIEVIPSLAEAEELIRNSDRSAILVFSEDFSEKMDRCSFLTKAAPEPLNPLYRDGINPEEVGLRILKDPTQQAAASIIEQVAQVTLFRVVIPWMIGKAFERVGDDEFMELLSARFQQVKPVPTPALKELDPVMNKMLAKMFADPKFQKLLEKELGSLAAMTFKPMTPKFQAMLKKVFQDDEFLANMGKDISLGEMMTPTIRKEIGPKVQDEIQEIFSNYNFRAKTWAGLTKSQQKQTQTENVSEYQREGALPKRGDIRFQVLVPGYAVTFAFFLVLTVGWQFVAERRQGTLVRLRAAPITRFDLLAGKSIPSLGISLFQGLFLMSAGWLIFGMSWGEKPVWMLAVIASTAIAATGLSLLIASIAKTETQVAVYGTLTVLVLAGIGGSMMPRELMPETMRMVSHVTPHAWALDAYQQLLINPEPNILIISRACGVLVLFGLASLTVAWKMMRLD
ncbi:ABC transporter permease [Zavarzinella formosa]|uniref:ABC transporter permease n=1 Tax=Zavarzinella formosa TaxID=360055 RepID=UPI0003082347|nr:ABC transporter permease [Zavarzinella formosa]